MKLKQLADIRTGLVLSRKKGDVHDDTYFTYKVVTLKAFNENGSLTYEYLDTFVSNEELSTTYLTKKGDILIRLREPNHAVLIDETTEGLVIPSLIAHVKFKEPVNEKFLTYYLNRNATQKKLQKEAKGTTISMINTKNLADLELHLPTLEKQKQVVSLLQLANKEITLLETLKVQKINYKNEILDMIINQGNQ